MAKIRRSVLVTLVLLTAVAGAVLYQSQRPATDQQTVRKVTQSPIPVEVAAVEQGPIEWRRTFSGSLEAHAELLVAPKVSGRIEHLEVDLSDSVQRGQLVALLDDAEYVQAVRQSEADLAVAEANLAEAQSLATIAGRELQRIEQLRKRGVSSESQRDAAKADQLAREAHVVVTRAQVTRAESALESARIRLGYTRIRANWHDGDDRRVVAERLVNAGETVDANAPLLRIVELDPVTVVFFVTERDYALLRSGQQARLRTDAFPGETFDGEITRISPVFREATRQARVEIRVNNPLQRLKPGMFVRATLVLERVEQATIVPRQALVSREGQQGLFIVTEEAPKVRWQPVEVGLQQDDRVQVSGAEITGQVVILGQQLLADGSPIRITGNNGTRP
ncbi:MAG: efflux RND transporter periplasmic adaptor subunit [Sedimenticola sp.]|nr:efflux RND transporter periplasmic adaptor subunit [Sedimenticola sp.]